MKRSHVALFVAFALLAVTVTALGTRVARQLERGGSWRVELGSERSSTLSGATQAKLASLQEKVLVTYAVSPAGRMPSDRKDLERRVVDLLEAMRRAAPEHFDYLIIDPDSDEALVGFASRRRFSPQRVRTVQGDAWSEREIWSSLSIAYGARPEAVLHGIGPEHLARLQETLLAQLEQMETPRRARIALAAPQGFTELEDMLAERAEVERVDLIRLEQDGGDPWPHSADLVLWLQPESIDTGRLEELERFLDAGRCVVLAGSHLRAGPDALQLLNGAPAISLRPAEPALAFLQAELGVEPVRGLTCDSRSDVLVFEGETLPAPFLLRCIAPNQDFTAWRRLPNGTLLFTAPTPLALDDERLRDEGLSARVLATSSDGTWLQEPPLAADAPLPLAALAPEAGITVAKQALIVELVPDDPWRGRALLLAGTTPFEDGMLRREGVAHGNLLRAILDEYTSDERLVVATAARERVPRLPDLSAPGRLLLRSIVLGLPLLGFFLIALLRGLAEGRSWRALTPALRPNALLAVFAGLAALAALAGLSRLASGLRAEVDLTCEGLHGLAPGSRAIARRSGDLGGCEVQLLVSAAGLLPPDFRPRVRRLEETLAALDRAGAELSIERLRPEELSGATLARRESEGLQRARATDADEERTLVRNFYAAVRMARGDSVELLTFTDALAFEELEFRLSFALWRLETGRHPRVGFASDVPRPSAAEAYENFQSKGLFAPTGTDVYAAARARLEGLDLDLVHVNPRAPVLPDDLDALLWLQPRRSIASMLEAALRYLVGGGDLLIAAQHFRVQARQYRGAGFEGVLWPQPQSPDLEHLWLPELGIQLVREVLFDARHTTLPIDTQVVGRRAGRVFERQEMALPFLIRADAAGFDREHPITRQLGDQALLFANELRWDEARLRELGLRARTLVETSPATWSYAWKGGWIPVEFLDGAQPEREGGSEELGRVPLVALFEGAFPVPRGHLVLNPPLDEESGEELPPPARADWPSPAEGRMLFVSSSEAFTDSRLLDPEFRGDHLLTNAALFLALPEELASIAQRRDVPRGFGALTERTRVEWRTLVLGAGPLLLVLVTLGWTWVRRRGELLP